MGLRETIADFGAFLDSEEMTDRHTDPLVFISTVFLLFGIAAFVLAASGIYGVVLNTIAQGNREIGLKRALGAGDERVIKEFLLAGLKQLLWGGIPGLLAGGAMGFAISRIRGVDHDGLYVLVSIIVVVVTAAVVMLSTWVPTRRALEVEPGVALRQE
jgi:ABC-type antimicrobial peptide transport system permease subunit